ncbi:unnamed protein product [Staurois parvus]|uniref:Uncharacterized protein n=1 Tax=Staurois parvus TaxID=386267 RepID=A0ABN9F7N1_9NEOB|nr:unnamed protein product [Staurois parvus]
MTRDCGHSTGDFICVFLLCSAAATSIERLLYILLYIVQEMTRDCGHSTGDDQRLRTQYRR